MFRRRPTGESPGRVPANRILIAGPESFPHGGGATARILAYARGLVAAGLDVTVVCLLGTERSAEKALDRSARGLYEGIPFEYSAGTHYREGAYVRRRIQELRSALRLRRLIKGEAGQPPADVILLSNKARWIVATVLACRAAASVCVLEKSEFPFIYARRTVRMKVWSWFFTRTFYKLIDGAIVISTCLEKYLSARVRRGAKIIRVPILVNTDDFREELLGDGRDRRVLCYVGNLNHKGEVEGLIDAFGAVEHRFPEWRLRVIGGSDDPSLLLGLQTRVAQMGLSSRIELLGWVDRDALPGLYREVGAFALPRASGLFSTAGFPTKLGEYLASGRPVIVTATGDIPLFLTDGVDAFLVPPDDPGAFAARLADMLADPVTAHAVGQRGRQTARRCFETTAECRRLAEFLRGFHPEQMAPAERQPSTSRE
jgi:glycosyltransferase involved in cell wall biosynthesis